MPGEKSKDLEADIYVAQQMLPAICFIGGNQEPSICHDFGAGAPLSGTAEDELPLESWCQQFSRPFIALPHSAQTGIAIQHHLDGT